MNDSETGQQQAERSRRAWALAVAGFSGLMMLWVPVGRRITTDRNLVIDTIDSATMPGLVLRAGADGNSSLVRVLAGVATVAVVGCIIATYLALSRRLDDALVVLGVLALVNLAAVIVMSLAMAGVRDSVQRGEFADVVEATSGLLLVAGVPVLLAMIVNLDLGFLSGSSKKTRSTQWGDD